MTTGLDLDLKIYAPSFLSKSNQSTLLAIEVPSDGSGDGANYIALAGTVLSDDANESRIGGELNDSGLVLAVVI